MSRVRGWTAAVLVVSLIELAALVAHLLALGRLSTQFERFLADPFDDGTVLDAAASTADRLDLVAAIGALAGVVVLVGWLHACVKAVATLDLGLLRHSSGWAIGAWFVPFLNLVRVPQIVADVYRAGRRQIGSVGAVVGGWWALWLIDAAVGRAAAVQKVPQTAEQVRQMLQLTATSQILGLLSTAATLGLVLLLTSGLRRAAAAVPAGTWADPSAVYAQVPTPNPLFGEPPAAPYGAPAHTAPAVPQYPPPVAHYAAPVPVHAAPDPEPYAAPAVHEAPRTDSPPPGPAVTSRTYLPE